MPTVDINFNNINFNNINFKNLIKEPRNRDLTEEELAFNEDVHKDRARVEHFFGQLKKRFSLFRYGYRGPVEFLLIVFRLGCVFTNRIIAQAN